MSPASGRGGRITGGLRESAAGSGVKRPKKLGRHLRLRKQSAAQMRSANPDRRFIGEAPRMQAWRSRSGTAEHISEGVNPAPATRSKTQKLRFLSLFCTGTNKANGAAEAVPFCWLCAYAKGMSPGLSSPLLGHGCGRLYKIVLTNRILCYTFLVYQRNSNRI